MNAPSTLYSAQNLEIAFANVCKREGIQDLRFKIEDSRFKIQKKEFLNPGSKLLNSSFESSCRFSNSISILS